MISNPCHTAQTVNNHSRARTWCSSPNSTTAASTTSPARACGQVRLSRNSTLDFRPVRHIQFVGGPRPDFSTPGRAAGRPMTNVIEVRGLTKTYGDFVAVDAIDFDVVQGEI